MKEQSQDNDGCPWWSPGSESVFQWLRVCLPMQGTWVQSLARELRFPHALGQLSLQAAPTTKSRLECCNEDRAQPKFKKKSF